VRLSRTPALKRCRWKMKTGSPLTEPLVVRPTSETIIGASYASGASYRDLPILINQGRTSFAGNAGHGLFCARLSFSGRKATTVHETETRGAR